MIFSRRDLLSASAALPFASASARAATAVTISVDTAQTGSAIPADYMGLGYEISSVAIPGLLAARNEPYVQLVKNLGPRGVIRIGGNTSDFATYSANGSPVSSPKGTVVTVTSRETGKSVTCTVTDRGPYEDNYRIIDLDRATFAQLADPSEGLIPVDISW